MPEYENNPLFNDQIRKFDGAVPNISFDYKWDPELSKWVPNTGEHINIGTIEIPDITISDLSDEETHALLSGISGVLEAKGESNDAETHSLLSGISGILESKEESNDGETHRILSGVSGLLGAFSGTNTETLTAFSSANALNLQKVEDAVKAIELGDVTITDADLFDEETHRILSGISGQDLSSATETQEILRSIKDNSCNTTLALEELKSSFRDITYHVKKFEEGNILKEVNTFEPLEHPEHSLIDRVYNKPYKNGRLTDRINSEAQQHPLIKESFHKENPERESVFDEAAPFSFKLENYKGDHSGWHPFFPFDKQLGLDDKVTVYNESSFPFEIMFRGGEDFTIYEGHQIELSKEEASQLYIRREYTISGFEVKYSIERMYTPEQSLKTLEDPYFTKEEQTHARIGLGAIMMNKTHVYIAHGNEWKRSAISSWSNCTDNNRRLYQIDYFDAYSSENFLHLNMGDGILRKLAIASWENCDKVPLECHNNLWADTDFIYAKVAGKAGNAWKRTALTEDN
jgi:hypothetical protein